MWNHTVFSLTSDAAAVVLLVRRSVATFFDRASRASRNLVAGELCSGIVQWKEQAARSRKRSSFA